MKTSLLLSALLLVTGCAGAASPREAEPVPLLGAPEPVPASPIRPAVKASAKPCAAEVRACVDLRAREAWLQSNGKVVYGPVPIASGPPGHATPRGTFDVLYKDQVHRSSTYGIAMPYSVFFAGDGIAFHEGPITAASHGCVHLSAAAAPVFFEALRPGDEVQVR